MTDGVLARLGRWCFRRRWWVLAAWLVVAAAGVLAAGPVFAGLEQGGRPKNVESAQAYEVLADGAEEGGEIIALVDGVHPDSPAVRTAVASAATELSTMSVVRRISHPYAHPATGAAYRSSDDRAVLIIVELGDLDGADRRTVAADVGELLDGIDTDLAAAGQPDADVELGGRTMLGLEANATVQQDLQRAELIGLPITLVVLVVVFGGLVAAGLPVLAAVLSVAAAMLLLLGFSVVTDLDSNVVTVVTLLGLGLSVDYGLLLVARYREELGRDADPLAAMGRTWATAGRTVLFSALSIAAALAGLLLFELRGLAALGAAGISVALVAMVVALTFTAALIGLTHRRLGPSARARRRAERRAASTRRAGTPTGQPGTPTGQPGNSTGQPGTSTAWAGTPTKWAETSTERDEVGFFAGLARVVQRRPLLVALATTAGLLAAGAPLLSMDLRQPDLEHFPRSIESVRVADELADRFGRRANPGITVVARTGRSALDAWAVRWADDPAVSLVEPARQVGDGLSTVRLAVAGDPQGDPARDLVAKMRADRPAGVESWITGDAAVLVDLLGMITSRLPAVVGTTLLAMMILLFLFTGSFVVPVKAVVANVVSLGATFGVLSAVFEHGFLAGPLDTITVGALDPIVIVIIFAFAFGLSMDYEVFLLGRVKEFVDTGLSTDAAVRRGLQHTGRIITSAALLMIIVFAGFAAGRVGQIEQVGLGLLVAVLIDATIVRCLLVPATMTLLGRWNWWAPRWARRLHGRVGLRETAAHPVAGPAREPQEVVTGAR